jgi:tetratricopeptide (TPR) repeat protein
MFGTQVRFLAVIVVIAASGLQNSWARDIRITLPKRSGLTPVQRLNREGVDAVRKQEYEKAEEIFYKAYLYDPADPFTLNNLGYVSELQGKLESAQKFYTLASEQGSDAFVDRSNEKDLIGKPMSYALGGIKSGPVRVNHLNVEAIELLSEDRNSQADLLLKEALALDHHNTFTLNNLGVAEEALGDYDEALNYYNEASDAHSSERIVVTLDRSWKGKPVSKMAAESARKLRTRMEKLDTPEKRAAMLAMRGVSATNRNDWSAARQDFLRAYSLNPGSAFSLNNRGYVAEKDGDIETAQFYYDKARKADDANARVGLATRSSAEGQRVFVIAADSDQKIDSVLDAYTAARRRQTGPIELKRRDNNPAPPSASPNPKPSTQSQPPQ